jgi:hypothetical protein
MLRSHGRPLGRPLVCSLAHLSLHRPARKVIKHNATWQTRLDVRALLDQPLDGALGDVEPLGLGDGLDLAHEGVAQRQGLVRGLKDPVGLDAGDGGERVPAAVPACVSGLTGGRVLLFTTSVCTVHRGVHGQCDWIHTDRDIRFEGNSVFVLTK